ncbi:hypothetical protein [Isoptericola sp. AK164]|uniref:hypothetical protein n=1 Tax=Isoptericola sp. AK164 TaxID=3024246 RepID=UPI0024186976|nr:hypothetical protein [Isoptericola sp. AK164]
MRLLGRVVRFAFAIVAAAFLAAAASAPAAAADVSPGPGQPRVDGFVTVNGDVAPPGLRVAVVALDGDQETRCGDFVTGEGATFELILPAECGPGATAVFRVDTGTQSDTVVEITEDQRFTTTVDFQLSATELVSLGIQPSTTPEVAVISSSPLQGTDLRVVVLSTVIPATLLLVVMVLMKASFWRRGTSSGGGSTPEDKGDGTYRSQIEGMVLVMVVLAVILLGVTDKIGSDGLVSVLAAIVGYTVGRQVGARST